MATHPPPSKSRDSDQSFKKANEAIAIRPKRGKMTLLSRRIFNALVFHAQRQGVDRPIYTLPLSELIGDARFNSNNTELLKAHLRDMQATTIEWSTSGAGVNRWTSTQLLGTVTIEDPGRGKACTISWRYPEEIREQLIKPMQYTRVLLDMSAQMRSLAASVLYEIGARYLTSPTKLTMREDVLWWAAVLTGRSDIEEVDYRFLKRDTISKALIEVDALCDTFSLELIEHKRGRKIEEIQFRVVPKKQQRIDDLNAEANNMFDLEIVGRMIALGVKQDEASDIYATTDEGQLRATLDLVEDRRKSQSLGPLLAPAAYFRDALKKGYAGIKEKASQGAPQIEQKTRQLSEEEKMQRMRELWESDRTANAKAMYAEMLDQQQAQTRARFDAERLEDLAAPIAKAWRKDGPASRLAQSSFYKWLAQETWPEEPTDKVLLDFALKRGVSGI
jgi:hypothetical protein